MKRFLLVAALFTGLFLTSGEAQARHCRRNVAWFHGHNVVVVEDHFFTPTFVTAFNPFFTPTFFFGSQVVVTNGITTTLAISPTGQLVVLP